MAERNRQNTFRSQTGSGKKETVHKGTKGRELPMKGFFNSQKGGSSQASDEKQLNKLKRRELLEILVDQSREIDRLRSELKAAQDRLADREVKVREAGTLAEASLQIYNIFETAQNAADLYLENIKRRAGVEIDRPASDRPAAPVEKQAGAPQNRQQPSAAPDRPAADREGASEETTGAAAAANPSDAADERRPEASVDNRAASNAEVTPDPAAAAVPEDSQPDSAAGAAPEDSQPETAAEESSGPEAPSTDSEGADQQAAENSQTEQEKPEVE